jgi:hypothetical protein
MGVKYLSKETLEVLATQKGYRNDSYGNSGVTDIESVLKHEILVNGNTDIPEYVKEQYGLTYELEKLHQLNDRLQNEEVSEDEVDELIRDIKEKIRTYFGHDNVSCLWLSTRKGIEENYNGKEEGMNCYQLTGVKLMPISDLEDQGTLYVMDTHPNNLVVTEIEPVMEFES